MVLDYGSGGGVVATGLVAVRELDASRWRCVWVEQPWRVAGKRIVVSLEVLMMQTSDYSIIHVKLVGHFHASWLSAVVRIAFVSRVVPLRLLMLSWRCCSHFTYRLSSEKSRMQES